MGNPAVRVVVACAGINLVLGVLYSWHVAKGALLEVLVRGGQTDVTLAALGDVYGVACLVYALATVLAGRMLDDVGPRAVAFLGAVLVGLGFLLVGLAKTHVAWVAGFGVIVGAGLGFCHAATIPTALRWYPRTRSGLIAGIVVAGPGLAALYVAPLASWLIASRGVQDAMLVLGAGFVVVVSLLSQFLAVPSVRTTLLVPVDESDGGFGRQLRSPTTWWLWVALFIASGAGMMAGGLLSELAEAALGDAVFAAIVVMAIAGTSGRLVVGALSDRHGRPRTLTALLAAQAVAMLAVALTGGLAAPPAAVVLALVGLVAFNYGGNFALFPAFVRDRFGLRAYGRNYGVIFTAWGVGGLVMGEVGETLHAATLSHRPACLLAAAMLLAGSVLSRRLHERASTTAEKEMTPKGPPGAPSVRSAG